MPYPTGTASGPGAGVGWGEQKALMDSQAQVPVSSPQAPGTSAPPDLGALVGSMGPGPAPGELGDFGAPTARPGEPITHGLPTGPGAGPEVLRGGTGDSAKNLVRQLANSPFASEDIRELLNLMG